MINFQDIIKDLNLVYTQQEIADFAGLTQTAISNLKQGRNGEPGYNSGAQLVIMHRRAVSRIKRRQSQ